MAFCAVAGFRSIVIAGGFGLNSGEIQAMQRRKVPSSKARVSSARLRPNAMRSSQSDRCVAVSAQPPPFGTMKKVSCQHGFNRSICATGPAPEENEPTEEPGDGEPTSDESSNINQAFHEVTTNGTPYLFKEDKQIIEEFNKRKLQIYEEYITQDNFSDDEPLVEAFNEILAEYYSESVEQKNAMKVVAQLEELYRKTPNAEALVKPDVFDYAFLALLSVIFVITGLAGYMSVFSEPVAQQLHALLPIIKKEFGTFFYYALELFGRFNN